MGLETVDKLRISSFIRNHGKSDIYISDFFQGVKSNKYSELDVLKYLVDFVESKLNDKKELVNLGYINKLFNAIDLLVLDLVYMKVELDSNLLDRLNAFESNFKTYLETNGLEDELDTDSIIKQITGALKTSDYNKDILEKYIEEIEDLKLKIKELTSLIEEKNKEIKGYDNELKKVNKENEKNLKTINSKDNEIEKKNHSIEELQKTIDSLNSRISTLKTEYLSLTSQNRDFEKLNSEINRLKEKVDKQKEVISELKKLEESIKVKKEKEEYIERMDNIIFELLCCSSYTLKELTQKLKEKNIHRKPEEIMEALKRVKNRICIEKSLKQLPPIYELSSPSIENNMFLQVNSQKKCYDVLLVSDMHLCSMDDDKMYWLDQLYNYASGAGIELIVNLGDFVSEINIRNKESKLDSVLSLEHLIEEIIEKFPHDENITHVLMGGNHDKLLLDCGIDPIAKVCEGRNDFINLGYDHATLFMNKNLFGEAEQLCNNIVLHHPNFRAAENLLEANNFDRVNTYLNSYYEQNKYKVKKDGTYLDVLGHFHKSTLDVYNNCLIMPSYFVDRAQNGAWHMKVFFSNKNNISHITLIPLVCGDKLMPSTEVSYKKTMNNQNVK